MSFDYFQQEKTTLVTLGANENTKSEEELKDLLKDFGTIGTDPFRERIYAYEKFNQVALSIDNNKLLMTDSNDKYADKNYVATINQHTFFNETVGVKVNPSVITYSNQVLLENRYALD